MCADQPSHPPDDSSSSSLSSSSSSSSSRHSIRDEAICIRRWDYSETSQTVSLFTREHGVLRGLAKGSKRERSGFSGGIELLTRGEILGIVKANTDLATLTEWNLLEIFPVLSRSLAANRAALYFADLIHHMLTDLDPHPVLYDGLLGALRGLNGTGVTDEVMPRHPSAPMIVLALQWLILCECGYRPVLEHDARTGEAFSDPGAEEDLKPEDRIRDRAGDRQAGAGPRYAFSAAAGGLVNDTGDNNNNNNNAKDQWRVRAETVAILRRMKEGDIDPETILEGFDIGDGAGGDCDAGRSVMTSVERANRLLAAYIRTIIDREPITMVQLFGRLAV